jgi:hypothetical protein
MRREEGGGGVYGKDPLPRRAERIDLRIEEEEELSAMSTSIINQPVLPLLSSFRISARNTNDTFIIHARISRKSKGDTMRSHS